MERFATTLLLLCSWACLPVDLNNRRCGDNSDCLDGYSCRSDVCVTGLLCQSDDDCSDNAYCVLGACRSDTTNPSSTELLSDDCPSFIGDASDIAVVEDGRAIQVVATLLPLTKLDIYNPAGLSRADAIQLATRNFNDAGGIFGRHLVWLRCNSNGDQETAIRAMRHLADVGITAVVGEAASSTTVAAFAEAKPRGMWMVAPSSTSVNLTGLDDDGLLFRTTVSDIRQGEALTNYLIAKDHQRIAVLASRDIYASTLRTSIRATLCDTYPCANLDRYIAVEFPAEPTAAQIDTSLTALDPFNPDVIVILGQDVEVQPILTAIVNRTPLDAAALLLTDTAKKDSLLSALPAALAQRIRGTAPAGQPSSAAFNDFVLEMASVFPGTIDGFAPHAYDAAMVVALAHIAIGDMLHPRGSRLAAAVSRLATVGAPMVRLSGLNDNNVNALQAGVALLHDGNVVDLDGVSGPLDFDSNGDVLGDIELWRRCQTGNGDVGVSLGVVLSADDVATEVDESCPSCAEVGCPDGTTCVMDTCQ